MSKQTGAAFSFSAASTTAIDVFCNGFFAYLFFARFISKRLSAAGKFDTQKPSAQVNGVGDRGLKDRRIVLHDLLELEVF